MRRCIGRDCKEIFGYKIIGKCLVGLICLANGLFAVADEPIELVAPANQKSSANRVSSVTSMATVTPQQVRTATQWLGDLAIRKMPRQIDGEKDWGKTKQVWSGVKMRMDGLRLKTHRRHRDVKHGRWIRYELNTASMLPIEVAKRSAGRPGEQPSLVIDRVMPDQSDAGLLVAKSPDQWKIQSTLILPMSYSARVQRWNLDVRLFSVTVTGSIRLKIQTTSTIGFVIDYAEIPPAMVLDPRVVRANVELEQFKVNRISNVGGEFAQAWGEIVEEVLVERLVEKQGDRLTRQLNRAIEKQRDELRFSMTDWLTGFAIQE